MGTQLRNAILRLQTWRIVTLELDPAAPQIGHRGVEVVDLEPGYRAAGSAGGRRRIDDDESPAPALETKARRIVALASASESISTTSTASSQPRSAEVEAGTLPGESAKSLVYDFSEHRNRDRRESPAPTCLQPGSKRS